MSNCGKEEESKEYCKEKWTGMNHNTNQELETHLYIFCTNNLTKWAQFLSSTEFHHNSAPHSSTNVSSSSLLYSYEPHSYPTLGKTFLPALETHLSLLDSVRKEALAVHESARNSCLLTPLVASILGKSEIRSGLKPLILGCTTLPGNSPPNDMAPSRLLRYYLHLLTNSDCPPHEGYMTSSMLLFYPLITPPNHMAQPSHLCLPTS